MSSMSGAYASHVAGSEKLEHVVVPIGTICPVYLATEAWSLDVDAHTAEPWHPPEGWLLADGARIKRREHPDLYAILKPVWRNRWRRWRVHLPDMRKTHRPGTAGWMAGVVYLVRAS